MNRSQVAVTFSIAVIAASACGERTPGDESRTNDAQRATVAVSGDSAALGDSLVPAPESFARACIAGDPVAGVHWRLDSVALESVAVTGIETVSPRDSAQLAARIARMVDVIPSDTSLADFRGLPVTVRAAWRLAPSDRDTIVVALAVRRVPIESAPLEELFTVVAAPGQRTGVRDPLVEGWFVRDVGLEDALVARELAGAYLRADTLVLAFVEDAEGGVRVALVQRQAGRWLAGWSGTMVGCTAP